MQPNSAVDAIDTRRRIWALLRGTDSVSMSVVLYSTVDHDNGKLGSVQAPMYSYRGKEVSRFDGM